MFFFLLFVYFLGKCLNVKDEYKKSGNKWLDYLCLKPTDVLYTAGFFILSFLSHQLVFLAIFAVGFYHWVIFVRNIILRKTSFTGINAVISYLFVVFCVVAFVPSVQAVMKSLLMLFLPERIATWVLPDLGRLAALFHTEPYKSFKLYFDVLREDFNYIYILGFVGLVWSWFKYKKAGIYISSLLVIIFLLMSFVYREPALPRYLIFIYPFFLVGMAIVCSEIVTLCTRKVKSAVGSKVITTAVLLVALVCSPVFDSVGMVARKAHGRVVPFAFSQWYFSDWKTTLNSIEKQLTPDDIVLATITTYPSFYLNRPTYQFRQKFYNTTSHKYELLPVDTTNINAHSVEAIAHLLRNYKTGWLFADYYLQGALTDPAAREFIINNTDFMFAQSNSFVKVFHWDHAAPPRFSNAMVELLTPTSNASQQYNFELNSIENLHGIKFEVEAEGVCADNELVVLLNGYQIGVSQKQGENTSAARQLYILSLRKEVLKEGKNTIQFLYNTNFKGLKEGKVAIYNIVFSPY
jgi:hypothetical membrane protein